MNNQEIEKAIADYEYHINGMDSLSGCYADAEIFRIEKERETLQDDDTIFAEITLNWYRGSDHPKTEIHHNCQYNIKTIKKWLPKGIRCKRCGWEGGKYFTVCPQCEIGENIETYYPALEEKKVISKKNKTMKITDKEIVSITRHNRLWVETPDGRQIVVSKQVWDSESLAIPETTYEILEDGDQPKNEKEKEEIIDFLKNR